MGAEVGYRGGAWRAVTVFHSTTQGTTAFAKQPWVLQTRELPLTRKEVHTMNFAMKFGRP